MVPKILRALKLTLFWTLYWAPWLWLWDRMSRAGYFGG